MTEEKQDETASKEPEGEAQKRQSLDREPSSEENTSEGIQSNIGVPAPKKRLTLREKILAGVAGVVVIAAVAGFGLYACALPPASAAAKVKDSYIAESDVSTWISQYRASNSLEDDIAFAEALTSQNLNVSTFRQNAINQLALSLVISNRAAELGKTPTDEQAQEQLDSVKQSMAFNDESVWQETLASYGLTEEGLLNQYKTNIAERSICESDVVRRDASDDNLLAYVQTYLANSTQKHAYRIVFTGDDAATRAEQCMTELQALQTAGTLDTAAFAQLAKSYSDEEGVQDTGGSYAWSGAGMTDEAKAALEYLEVGAISGTESVQSDNATEIFFCDTQYTFPSASDMAALPEDAPEELMAEVREAAGDAVWESDCNAYLSSLLAAAKITYYPIPDGAAYNIDLTQVG